MNSADKKYPYVSSGAYNRVKIIPVAQRVNSQVIHSRPANVEGVKTVLKFGGGEYRQSLVNCLRTLFLML